MKRSYILNVGGAVQTPVTKTYNQKELEEMTTYQLREICQNEKIIKGITNPLNRYELIETILRYRGVKEALLITTQKDGGFERLEDLMRRKLGSQLKDEGTIRNPARITIYEGLDLTLSDRYEVDIIHRTSEFNLVTPGNRVTEGNVLLVNENNELCGIFNLVADNSTEPKYFLTKAACQPVKPLNNKLYSLLFFEKKESDYIYHTYYGNTPSTTFVMNYFKIPVADFEIRQTEETEAVLSIDFGTSNTTAGSYLDYGYVSKLSSNDILNGVIQTDEINIVQFLDTTSEKKKWSPLLPTVVSVADCSNPEAVQYKFGYDAKKEAKVKYYDETFSVFYEIKRWVNSYDAEQELVDKQGHIAVVKRREIIREYLLYVIRCAGQQFKCQFKKLHITCPVKQKQQFAKMFQEVLPEYEVNTEKMLDEGTAVVYNTIANLITKKRFVNNEWLQALIIDCGGGTTDLSSCAFAISNNNVSYDVDIKTTYENGDTNFGGNNITYRIMQYIKIIFATHYSNRSIPRIDELITVSAEDIFRYVDEYGKDKVYEKLEAAYNAAEAVIPTKFKNYENHTRDDYYMVKNNFYFLFDIAEKMKKKFYMQDGVLRNCFNSNYESEQGDLKITRIDRWNLVVMEDGKLTYNHTFPDVVFNIKEIELLLKADIYEIVDKFLFDFYQRGELGYYSIIKLTGQSCRIDIFKEALKEFVPGKSIEFKQFGKDEASILELKLSCVKGAIQYVNAEKIGYTNVTLEYDRPMIPYSISGYTHENQEKMLIYSLDREQTYGYISRNRGVTLLELFLKDELGNEKYRYSYQNQLSAYEPVSFEKLKKTCAGLGENLIQDDVDNIAENETKFFIFAAKEDWGFYIVPVSRIQSQLYQGVMQYFPFENDAWEVDFFDGTK